MDSRNILFIIVLKIVVILLTEVLRLVLLLTIRMFVLSVKFIVNLINFDFLATHNWLR